MSSRPIGYVAFDTKVDTQYSSLSAINVFMDNIDKIHRGKYVRIDSTEGRRFVGQVVAGPFYMPEGLSPSSHVAQAFTIRGERFKSLPPYYAVFYVEILGEWEKEFKSTYTKPRPKSPVYEMGALEISDILGLSKGDMVLGHHIGYKGVKIKLPSSHMDVLPRNVGIFGTVGSGKTNTAQVLIEEAARHNWSVIVIDIEGEYTYMDYPNDDPEMYEVLKSIYGIEPFKIENFHVFVPVGRDSTRGSEAVRFGIPFFQINPYVLAEIIRATEPQQRYLSIAIGELLSLREGSGAEEATEFEEFAFGGSKEVEPITLEEVINHIESKISSTRDRGVVSALTALSTKLRRLDLYGVIDEGKPIDFSSILKPGHVSVLDVSDVEDNVRNICIAWLLDTVFNLKLRDVERKLPKIMIVIEEAHAFVSKEVRDKMEATIDLLKRIARRGRKRWISLVFISQQPGHLPPEIFELCNTRIIHQLRSEMNIKAIRETTGALTRELARNIVNLSKGEAIVTSPVLRYPVLCKIRPAATKRFKH